MQQDQSFESKLSSQSLQIIKLKEELNQSKSRLLSTPTPTPTETAEIINTVIQLTEQIDSLQSLQLQFKQFEYERRILDLERREQQNQTQTQQQLQSLSTKQFEFEKKKFEFEREQQQFQQQQQLFQQQQQQFQQQQQLLQRQQQQQQQQQPFSLINNNPLQPTLTFDDQPEYFHSSSSTATTITSSLSSQQKSSLQQQHPQPQPQQQQQPQQQHQEDISSTPHTHEVIETLAQDYAALKYLIDENTKTQTILNTNYEAFNEKQLELVGIEKRFNAAIESLKRFDKMLAEYEEETK